MTTVDGRSAVAPGAARAAVELAGLRKSYGTMRAIAGIDLTVTAGEVVALLGPNGAGKSTLIDLLTGLNVPEEGTAVMFGRPPRRAIADGLAGVMLQDGALPEDATVAEVLRMIAALHAEPMPLDEVCRRAGVAGFARRRCGKLSGGQRQRVRFGMALIPKPELLVLDEPTAALDVTARREFWQTMRELAEAGRTVLFATHHLEEAEQFADRVVLMQAGQIVADGTVERIRQAVTGRTITAIIPGATVERLARLPGVREASVGGDRAELMCADSDAAAKALFAEYPQAREFQVVSPGLEAAFLALTSTGIKQEER